MAAPNLEVPSIRDAYYASGATSDSILAAVSEAIREVRADVEELRPKLSTYSNGDPLEVALAHLTLALTLLPDKR